MVAILSIVIGPRYTLSRLCVGRFCSKAQIALDNALLGGYPQGMRRLVIITFCLLAALTGVVHLKKQSRTVSQLDANYDKVQRGMSFGQVGVVMNRNNLEVLFPASGEDMGGWWNNKPLDASETARIRTVMRYKIPQFPSSVSYVFTFDEADKLVGKRRHR